MIAKVSTCDSIGLFLQRIFCLSGGKLGKLLDIGSERIDSEFDVVKIAKRLRYFKVILKEADIINDKIKTLAKSRGISVIDLSSEKDSSFSDPESGVEQLDRLAQPISLSNSVSKLMDEHNTSRINAGPMA